jgi:hypothetical protein
VDEQGPEYRTIAVYWTLAEAELARGVLEAEGIPAAFVDAADAALLPGSSAVRVLVPACDVERSRDLLRGDEDRDPAVDDDRGPPDEALAPEPRPATRPWWWVAAVIFATSVALLAAVARVL